MSFFSIIILSIALSIDACVVSFAHGLVLCGNNFKNAFSLAFYTGLFQAIMPIIGYFITQSLYKYIEPFDKWIVFAIFMYLGLKIIKDSFNEDIEPPICLSVKCLLFIAIATSIDALAAGVNIFLTSTNIIKTSLLIGLTTFCFAFCGYFAGCFLKKFPTKFLEISAGLILIFLSIKSIL